MRTKTMDPAAGQDIWLGIRFYGPDYGGLGESWNLQDPVLSR